MQGLVVLLREGMLNTIEIPEPSFDGLEFTLVFLIELLLDFHYVFFELD